MRMLSSGVPRNSLIAGSLGLFLTGSAAQGQCQYEVTVIQAPACPIYGTPPTLGISANEKGHVVGYHWQCGDTFGDDDAFVWTTQSALITLDRLPGFSQARAADLNDLDQIVGFMRQGLGSRFAAVWQNDSVLDLGTLPGGNLSEAHAINEHAQVVGYWGNDLTNDPGLSAFLWQDGVMTDLGPILGTPRSVARDINEAGAIVGWMGVAPSLDACAFILDGDVVTQLSPIQGGITSAGFAINNLGDVAGRGRFVDRFTRERVWRGFSRSTPPRSHRQSSSPRSGKLFSPWASVAP